MHKRFQVPAAFAHTGERRLIFMADAASSEAMENFKGLVEGDENKDLRKSLKERVRSLLETALHDEAAIRKYRSDVFAKIEEVKPDEWKNFEGDQKAAMVNAFPIEPKALIDFLIKNDIVDITAAVDARDALERLKPASMARNRNDILSGQFIEGEGSETAFRTLIQKLEDTEAKIKRNFEADKGRKPGTRINPALAAERKTLSSLRQATWEQLKSEFPRNYEAYKFKKGEPARRLQQIRDAARAREERPVDPLLGGSQAARDFENVVAAKKRNARRSMTPEESARSNLIKEWRKDDFVDNGQIPTYEYKENPKLKRLRPDGKGGYADHTEDYEAFQEEQRSSSGDTASRGPKKKAPVKRANMFGNGTVDEGAYNKMVKRSTDHLDKNVQNQLRSESNEKFYQQATEALADLERNYPNANEAHSYPLLQQYVRRAEYQKIVFQVGAVKRELALQNNFASIAEIPMMESKQVRLDLPMDYPQDKPANLNERITVRDVTANKTYSFRPQYLHSATTGAQDIKEMQEMAKAGIIVKIERNGVKIPYSQMNYVSGVTIGLRAETVNPSNPKKNTKEKNSSIKISSAAGETEIYNAYEGDMEFVDDGSKPYEPTPAGGSPIDDLADAESAPVKPTGLKLRIPSNDQSPDKLPFQKVEQMGVIQSTQNSLRLKAKGLAEKYKTQKERVNNALLLIATRNATTIARMVSAEGRGLAGNDGAIVKVLLKQREDVAKRTRTLERIQSGLNVKFAKMSEDWSLAMFEVGVNEYFGGEMIDATIIDKDGKVFGHYSVIKSPGTLMQSLGKSLQTLETTAQDIIIPSLEPTGPVAQPNPSAGPQATPVAAPQPLPRQAPPAAPQSVPPPPAPTNAPEPMPAEAPAPAPSAEQAPENLTLTREQFETQKGMLLAKQAALLREMDGTWNTGDSYRTKVENDFNIRLRDFNPTNRLVLHPQNVDQKKENEWNLQQLEMVYNGHKKAVDEYFRLHRPAAAPQTESTPDPAAEQMQQLSDEIPVPPAAQTDADARMQQLNDDIGDVNSLPEQDILPIELDMFTDLKNEVIAVDKLLLKISKDDLPAAQKLRDKCVSVFVADPTDKKAAAAAKKVLSKLRVKLEGMTQQ